jgi:hypothetical protein
MSKHAAGQLAKWALPHVSGRAIIRRALPIENFGRSDADKEIREAGGQDRRRMGADGFAMDGVLRYIQGG